MIRRRMAVLEQSPDLAILYLVMAACAVATCAELGGVVSEAWFLFSLPIFFLAWSFTSMVKKRKARKGEVEVVFDENGIQIENEPLIGIEKIVHGVFVPGGERRRLRIVGPANTTVFEGVVEDEAEANELLRAIGRDPSRARARFETAPPKYLRTRSRGAVGVLSMITMFSMWLIAPLTKWVTGGFPMVMLAFLGVITAYLLSATFAPASSVEIGIDGVEMRWLTRRRFIPFDEIADVKVDKDDAVLILRNAEYVPIGFFSKRQQDDEDDRAAFVTRLRSAMAGRVGHSDAQQLLARGKQSVKEWAKTIAASREGGYRDAGLRDEDLALTLADPQSPADVRFAAAWLLARDRENGRPRVRVAIEAIAEPAVRVALERATETDDFEEAWGDEADGVTEERARGSS